MDIELIVPEGKVCFEHIQYSVQFDVLIVGNESCNCSPRSCTTKELLFLYTENIKGYEPTFDTEI